MDQGQADSRKRPEQMVYPRDLIVMFMQLLHPAALFPQIEPGAKIFAFAANHQNPRTLIFVELAELFLNGAHHLQIHGVALAGTVENQRRNPIALLEKDFFGWHIHLPKFGRFINNHVCPSFVKKDARLGWFFLTSTRASPYGT